MTHEELFEKKIGSYSNDLTKSIAKDCASLSKDVSVKFAEFLEEADSAKHHTCFDYNDKPKRGHKHLFDYFITNVYGK